MKAILALATGVSFLPLLLQGIIAVESAMRGASGTSKKEVVLASVQAVATTAEMVPEVHVQTVGVLIDALVAALNKTGYFTTKSAASTPAV